MKKVGCKIGAEEWDIVDTQLAILRHSLFSHRVFGKIDLRKIRESRWSAVIADVFKKDSLGDKAIIPLKN